MSKLSEITADLVKKIENNTIGQSGDRFYTIRQIANAYNISLETACKCAEELAAMHLITLCGKHYYITNGLVKDSTEYGTVLKARRKPIFGFHVTKIGSPFFSAIASRLSRIAWQNGYMIYVSDSGMDTSREIDILDHFVSMQVSGVFSFPGYEPKLHSIYNRYPLPIVTMGRNISVPYRDTVMVNNFQAGARVANHLWEIGCDRFLYVGLNYIKNADPRLMGYRTELQKLKCPLPEENIVLLEHGENDIRNSAKMQYYLHQMLSKSKKMGIFCYHDLLAVEMENLILHTLDMEGKKYRIPEDAAIVGFDDLDICKNVYPPLSTVSYRYDAIAEKAFEVMMDALTNPQHISGCYEITSSLTIRNSSL